VHFLRLLESRAKVDDDIALDAQRSQLLTDTPVHRMSSKRLLVLRGHEVHVAMFGQPPGQLSARLCVLRKSDGEEVFSRPHAHFPREHRRAVVQWALELGDNWVIENC
jgi:hypothetical protein